MREIKNVSDQLTGFAMEVVECVEKVKDQGFNTDQAIEITRLAIEDIRIDIEHHKNRQLEDLAHAVDKIAEMIRYK